MDNVNDYTKLMGEWLESSIDPELLSCIEETYNLLKASKAIASTVFPKYSSSGGSVLNGKETDVEHDLILDTYQLIVDTKNRNMTQYDMYGDIYIKKDILEDIIIEDVETEEEDI